MIECLICHQNYKNRTSLCNHIGRKHKLNKKDYYDNYIKQSDEGICKYSECNKPTYFLDIERGYKDCCCLEHTNLYRYGVKSNLNFEETKLKAQKNSHTTEANEKGLQTRIALYGGSGFSSPIIKAKIERSMKSKYGTYNPWQSEVVKQKSAKTKLDKYGNANYNNPLKARKTCLEHFGVESPSQSDEIKEKIKQTCNIKYGTDYYVQSKEFGENKVKNKRFSKTEIMFMQLLDEHNINYIQEYKDFERYPYFCDFYLSDFDIFIELHFYWTHGGHRFDENNKEDIAVLEKWKSKNSDRYKAAIQIWTKVDVEKLNCAINNNLNYVTLYNIDEVNDWIANFRKEYYENI